MIRSRSRKATVRLENLEARIAMSGVDLPPDADPGDRPVHAVDVDVAELPADDLLTPVTLTIGAPGTDSLHPDHVIDPSKQVDDPSIMMMWMTGEVDGAVSSSIDPAMPLLHDVPLMAQSGIPTAGVGAGQGSMPWEGPQILPHQPQGDPDVMTITNVTDDGVPLPELRDVPLMVQSGLASESGARPLRFDIDPRGIQLPVVTDAGPEAQVQLLSGTRGGGQATRLTVARPLSGVLRGEYQVDASEVPIDGGARYRLDGEGRFGSMGAVNVTGNLLRDGFVTPGGEDLSGVVTLKDSRGALSVRLQGSSTGLTSGRPVRVNASIVNGSGPYQSVRGIGPGTLRLGPNGFNLGLNLAPPRR